jgi:hypothetical protein
LRDIFKQKGWYEDRRSLQIAASIAIAVVVIAMIVWGLLWAWHYIKRYRLAIGFIGLTLDFAIIRFISLPKGVTRRLSNAPIAQGCQSFLQQHSCSFAALEALAMWTNACPETTGKKTMTSTRQIEANRSNAKRSTALNEAGSLQRGRDESTTSRRCQFRPQRRSAATRHRTRLL